MHDVEKPGQDSWQSSGVSFRLESCWTDVFLEPGLVRILATHNGNLNGSEALYKKIFMEWIQLAVGIMKSQKGRRMYYIGPCYFNGNLFVYLSVFFRWYHSSDHKLRVVSTTTSAQVRRTWKRNGLRSEEKAKNLPSRWDGMMRMRMMLMMIWGGIPKVEDLQHDRF